MCVLYFVFFYIHEGCYVVACLCLSVCQSARWLKKKFGRIVTNVYWWVGIVTSNSWLDFGGDPNHNMNTGIFRWNFCHYGIGHFYKFCWWLARETVNEFFRIFVEVVWILTSKKAFSFAANPGHDPHPGIFKGIFNIAVFGQCWIAPNVSFAALVNVCCLQVLLVHPAFSCILHSPSLLSAYYILFVYIYIYVISGVWIGAGIPWWVGSTDRGTGQVQVGGLAARGSFELTEADKWREDLSTAGRQSTAAGSCLCVVSPSSTAWLKNAFDLFSFSLALQCSDTVGWAIGRASGL